MNHESTKVVQLYDDAMLRMQRPDCTCRRGLTEIDSSCQFDRVRLRDTGDRGSEKGDELYFIVR